MARIYDIKHKNYKKNTSSTTNSENLATIGSVDYHIIGRTEIVNQNKNRSKTGLFLVAGRAK